MFIRTRPAAAPARRPASGRLRFTAVLIAVLSASPAAARDGGPAGSSGEQGRLADKIATLLMTLRPPLADRAPAAADEGSEAEAAAVAERVGAALLGFSASVHDRAPIVHGESATLADRVGAALERLLGADEGDAGADGLARNGGALAAFYGGRGFRPMWIDAGGRSERALAALDALGRAAEDGLRPEDYSPPGADAWAKAGFQPERLAKLELGLTRALVDFGGNLRTGRLDPGTIDPELTARRAKIGDAELLGHAAAAADVRRFLADLAPSDPSYRRLRAALARHRAIEARGGWPTLAPGPSLARGVRDERVPALRRRLEISGDLATTGDEGDRFDRALEEAVRAFQRRHGLDADGVVGPATLGALNVPVAERIRQIIVNMERWRWMPDDLGERYILVNLAGFDLKVVEKGETVLAMPVVVGRPYRSTPVFSKPMTYLVTNPYWHIPRSIAVYDIVPKARRDPGYLVEQGIRVFAGWGEDTVELNPLYVDWSRLGPRNFPFQLRQDPGPRNALGRIKFMLPNDHAVYLHDTPDRHLFEQNVRAASSGCIRLADPVALADYLLRGEPHLKGGVHAAIASGRTRDFRLEKPIPVHLTYATAWADGDGTVNFRDDVYGRDAPLMQALFPAPAGAPARTELDRNAIN